MTRYLISFPSGAMDHLPQEEFPAVGEAAHAVVQEAMDAGVWGFGGGVAEDVDPVMVAGDGTITAGTYPQTKEFNGGVHRPRRALSGRGPGVGREVRDRLPLRSRDPRVHARPSGWQPNGRPLHHHHAGLRGRPFPSRASGCRSYVHVTQPSRCARAGRHRHDGAAPGDGRHGSPPPAASSDSISPASTS